LWLVDCCTRPWTFGFPLQDETPGRCRTKIATANCREPGPRPLRGALEPSGNPPRDASDIELRVLLFDRLYGDEIDPSHRASIVARLRGDDRRCSSTHRETGFKEETNMSDLRYPNESREYRDARELLLKEEQELVDKAESVAARHVF
jgi:hypothetical protein